MTAEEFLVWAETAPEGQHELVGGRVVAMAPEALRHTRAKLAVVNVLADAIRLAKAPCEAVIDGVGIRTGPHTVRQPDASVQCGPIDPASRLLDSPVIVVEVVSASTARIDAMTKTTEYFRVPSIAHYLIVFPEEGRIVHHARAIDGAMTTRIYGGGTIRLDPPGLDLPLADIIAAGSPEPGAGLDEGTL
jgi:Uma2 family endonuclease